MELALNLVWLGVSVFVLAAGLGHLAKAGDKRSAAVAAVALVCMVCLLFPVISMTDDLSSGPPAMIEPGKLKKMAHAGPVLTLLSRVAMPAPFEVSWATLDLHFDRHLPLQRIFSPFLNRRPPPHSPLV